MIPLLFLLSFSFGCRSDGEKINIGGEGEIIDSDNDGLSDEEEIENGSDPNNPDSDGDGIIDGQDPDSNGEKEDWEEEKEDWEEEKEDWEEEKEDWEEDWDDESDSWSEEDLGNVESDDDYQEGDCCYKLRMRDQYWDGWNGAYVTVNVGNTELIYAMEYGDNTNSVDICGETGSDIEFIYTSGDWDQENRFSIIDPNGEQVYQDGPHPSAGTVYSAQSICESVDSSEEEEEEEEEDPWDWGEPENSESFDATYEAMLYVANSDTEYVICHEAIELIIMNDDISNTISCTTSTGLELIYTISGNTGAVSDSGQGYGYGYPEGEITLTTPAGTTITTDIFGECYNGAYVAMFLWWEHEVQTPTGLPTYGGYIYTD